MTRVEREPASNINRVHGSGVRAALIAPRTNLSMDQRVRESRADDDGARRAATCHDRPFYGALACERSDEEKARPERGSFR